MNTFTTNRSYMKQAALPLEEHIQYWHFSKKASYWNMGVFTHAGAVLTSDESFTDSSFVSLSALSEDWSSSTIRTQLGIIRAGIRLKLAKISHWWAVMPWVHLTYWPLTWCRPKWDVLLLHQLQHLLQNPSTAGSCERCSDWFLGWTEHVEIISYWELTCRTHKYAVSCNVQYLLPVSAVVMATSSFFWPIPQSSDTTESKLCIRDLLARIWLASVYRWNLADS